MEAAESLFKCPSRLVFERFRAGFPIMARSDVRCADALGTGAKED